jgi:hypothetical protein
LKIRQSFWSSLLRSEIKKLIPSHLRLRAPAYILAAVLLPFLLPAASAALAGSATWNLNPTRGDWNTAANWTPAKYRHLSSICPGHNESGLSFGKTRRLPGFSTILWFCCRETGGLNR